MFKKLEVPPFTLSLILVSDLNSYDLDDLSPVEALGDN